jgi:pimeloyl-ACP methyl ester carboxylesterase
LGVAVISTIVRPSLTRWETLALDGGLAARRVVYVAPMVDLAARFEEFVRLVGLPARHLPALRARAEARYRIRWSELDLVARARRLTADLLVVHDRSDRRVPAQEARALADAWPRALLIATTGLGHNRILAAPAVIADAVSFLTA